MSTPLCQAPNAELPQLLFGLTRLGYRGTVATYALSSLVAHAQDYGVAEVLRWVEDDPGLVFMPSWQFHWLGRSNQVIKTT